MLVSATQPVPRLRSESATAFQFTTTSVLRRDRHRWTERRRVFMAEHSTCTQRRAPRDALDRTAKEARRRLSRAAPQPNRRAAARRPRPRPRHRLRGRVDIVHAGRGARTLPNPDRRLRTQVARAGAPQDRRARRPRAAYETSLAQRDSSRPHGRSSSGCKRPARSGYRSTRGARKSSLNVTRSQRYSCPTLRRRETRGFVERIRDSIGSLNVPRQPNSS